MYRPTHEAIDKLSGQVSGLTSFLAAVAELAPEAAAQALMRYKRTGSMDISDLSNWQSSAGAVTAHTAGTVTPTGSTADSTRRVHSRLRYGQRGSVIVTYVSRNVYDGEADIRAKYQHTDPHQPFSTTPERVRGVGRTSWTGRTCLQKTISGNRPRPSVQKSGIWRSCMLCRGV
jgi:hypothetical protein